MPEHSPEPWGIAKVEGTNDGFIEDADKEVVADHDPRMSDADLQRIVACVNACAGVPTSRLEPDRLLAEHHEAIERLEKRVAELEKANRGLAVEDPSNWWVWGCIPCDEGVAPVCSKCLSVVDPSEMRNHEASCWR